MVWGAISSKGKIAFTVVEETLNGWSYLAMI